VTWDRETDEDECPLCGTTLYSVFDEVYASEREIAETGLLPPEPEECDRCGGERVCGCGGCADCDSEDADSDEEYDEAAE
jgi:hypothetical protein